MTSARWSAAAITAAALLTCSPAFGAERVGLCPTDTRRSDAFVQLLCEGEAHLAAGQNADALEKFRIAATVGRLHASNELAWAGLAAAHCRRGEYKQGREWAAYFAQARRLWLGDLSCAAPATDKQATLMPYVHSRMCTEPLKADYDLIRAQPLSPIALDVGARLKVVADHVERDCTLEAPFRDAPAAEAQPTPSPKRVSKAKKNRRKSPSNR